MRIHSAVPFVLMTCAVHNAIAQPPLPVPIPAPAATKPKPRVGTPQNLLGQDVRAFVAELNGWSAFMTILPKIVGARSGYFGGNVWQKWWLETRGTNALAVSEVHINKIGGNEAEITISYRNNPQQAQATVEGPFTLKFGTSPLDYSPGGPIPVWQFVPQKPAEAESLSVAPLRWAIWMLAQSPEALPSFRAAQPLIDVQKEAPNRLKQLALGLLQFVQDYEVIYAFLPEFQEEALKPYLKNSEVWNVPGSNEKFRFNARLSGKNPVPVGEAARTILFYDGADEKPIFRYDGKTAVALADGHVELADAEQFKTFLWE